MAIATSPPGWKAPIAAPATKPPPRHGEALLLPSLGQLPADENNRQASNRGRSREVLVPERPVNQSTATNPTMKNYIHRSSRVALAALAAATLCLVIPAKAADENKTDTTTKSKLSAGDKRFVKKAYKGGMEEV